MNPKIVLKKVLIKLIMLITIQGIIGVYCRLFCIDPKIFIPIFLEGWKKFLTAVGYNFHI